MRSLCCFSALYAAVLLFPACVPAQSLPKLDEDGLRQLISERCTGAQPATIELPGGVIELKHQLLLPSNCSIRGVAADRTTLRAAASLSGGVIGVNEAQNVRVSRVGIEGNRAYNPNHFSCVDVVDSRSVTVDDVSIVGCPLHGVSIVSSKDIAIVSADIHHNGDLRPPTQTGAAISVSPGTRGVSRVRLLRNRIHDNNLGIQVTNGSSTTSVVSRIEIASNSINANANDGILATAFIPGGSKIEELRIEDNEVFCNGWPSGGEGFPSFCVPGILQHGSAESQSGAGIDVIQNDQDLVVKPVIKGNRLHHNVFEGLALATQAFSRVKVTGRRIVRISGPSSFQTKWKRGQVVTINNKPFKIDSVQDADHLLLQSSAGQDGNAGLAGPSYMGAVVVNNVSYENGNRARSVGPGFYSQFNDGNVYRGNRAWRNNFEGFENYFGSFTRHERDIASRNNTSNTKDRGYGFVSYGGLENAFVDVEAYDAAVHPTQLYGISIGRTSTDALVQSSQGRLSPAISTRDAGSRTRFLSSEHSLRKQTR